MADPLPPDLEAGHGVVGRQVVCGEVGDGGGSLGAHPAEHLAGELGVLGAVAGALARLGGEGGPLGQLRGMRTGCLPQRREGRSGPGPPHRRRRAPRRSRGRPAAQPGNAAIVLCDAVDLGALDEPEAAPEPLVEAAPGVAAEAAWHELPDDRRRPAEEPLVEAVAVERQPAAGPVEARATGVDRERQPGQSPAGADVDDIDMGSPGPARKRAKRSRGSRG